MVPKWIPFTCVKVRRPPNADSPSDFDSAMNARKAAICRFSLYRLYIKYRQFGRKDKEKGRCPENNPARRSRTGKRFARRKLHNLMKRLSRQVLLDGDSLAPPKYY